MSIYDKAAKQLSGLNDRFGFNPMEISQGDPGWHIMRAGVLSASNADKIVAKVGSETRQTYMSSLINQVICCEAEEGGSFKQTEFGKLYEGAARDALSVALGFVEIKEVPFIYTNDKLRSGVSPDGIFDNTIVELKVPYDGSNFAKFACFDGVKKSWRWQIAFQLWSTGVERHIFAQYNPRCVLSDNLFYQESTVSDADIATLNDSVPQFIYDLDKALERLGVKHGDHWAHLKSLRKGE